MISGMYMGEIVRLILCKLAKSEMLLQGQKEALSVLSKPGFFQTAYVSKIEKYGSNSNFI